jgi:hypothetical protein
MNAPVEPAYPLSSLFSGSEAAKVIDFLLSKEQHQTIAEIHAGTQISTNMINKIIDNLAFEGPIVLKDFASYLR